jgi:hypothetical protein
VTGGAGTLDTRGTGWSPLQIGLAVLLAGILLPAFILAGPAMLVVAVAVVVVAWLSGRPARGLAIFCWLLPFHIVTMAVLYGGLNISAGVVRTLAAWKEALLVACVVAAIVATVRRPREANRTRSSVNWVDTAVAALLVIATCHLAASGPWLNSELTLVGRAYAFRDVALFLLLYFVGRATGDDVAENPATLSRLYTIGVIVAIGAVIEYIFVPPELLAAIGTSRYFSEFLGAGAFTANNVYGLPDNYADLIAGRWVRRAGSTYLSSTALASAQVISIAAASVLVFRRDRVAHRLRWLGYVMIWVGLLLSITRMSIVAALVESLLIALWYRRWGMAISVVGGAIAAGCLAVVVIPELRGFLIDTLTFQTPSSVTHIAAWTAGLDVSLAHPLGAGLGSTDETAVRFGAQAPLTGDNLFFKYSAELGIPAFFVHLLALVGIGAAGWRAAKHAPDVGGRQIGLVVLALTVGILINGMTAVLYNSNFLSYVYFWLAGSAVTVAYARPVAQRETS